MRKSKKYSRPNNLSVGSRISNGEGDPVPRGNGVRAGPATEAPAAEAPATGDPTIGDPADVSAKEGVPAEVLGTEVPEEISGIETAVYGIPTPPGPTLLYPASRNPTPPPATIAKIHEQFLDD